MNHILLIEDNLSLALNIKNYLTSEGFTVTHVIKLEHVPSNLTDYSLILLDWMLPDGQGIDLLKKIRSGFPAIPIIFLTAKANLVDKVLGLESGANDYITKPFEPRELLTRIRVQLRYKTSISASKQMLEFSNLIIEVSSRKVMVSNSLVEMTKKEFELLHLLASSPGNVFTREELLNKIWGFENFPTTRTVDTHILQLRQKIGENYFETVRGVGYCFKI